MSSKDGDPAFPGAATSSDFASTDAQGMGVDMPANVVLGHGFGDEEVGSARNVDVTGNLEKNPVRREVWDMDDGKDDAKEGMGGRGTLGTGDLQARLGVLPSPGLEAFPELGPERNVQRAQNEQAKVAVLTPQEEEDDLYSVTPTESRHPIRSLEEREGKDVGVVRGGESEVPTPAPETVAQALPAPSITALGQRHAVNENSAFVTHEGESAEQPGDESLTRDSMSESWEKSSSAGSVRRKKPHRPSEVSAFDPEEEEGISRAISRRSSVSSMEREPMPPLPQPEAPAVHDEEAGMAAERARLEQMTSEESSRPAMVGRASLPSQQEMRATSVEQPEGQGLEHSAPVHPYQTVSPETMPGSPTIPDQTRFAYGRYKVANPEKGQHSTPLSYVHDAGLEAPLPTSVRQDNEVKDVDVDDQTPPGYPHTIPPHVVAERTRAALVAQTEYPEQNVPYIEGWQSGTHEQQERERYAARREYEIPTRPEQEAVYEAVPIPPPKDNVPQDIRSQRFAAPLIDPRQQGIEYQLPVPQVQSRRRSGIFESFRRMSSIGDALPRDEKKQRFEDQDPAVIAAQKARDNTVKPITLKKVQRSSTTASQPDPDKKNRFSRLGSLFGRSNTNAGPNTTKPNKLMKAQPRNSSSGNSTPSAAAAYPAYEATKRQQYANIPQLPVGQYQSRGVEDSTFGPQWQQQAQERSARVQNEMPIPPGGWYAPANQAQSQTAYDDQVAYNGRSAYYDQPVQPSYNDHPHQPSYEAQPQQAYPSAQQHRRLRSEGLRPGQRYSNVPEAFQPTAASYRNSYGPDHELPRQYEHTIPRKQPRRRPACPAAQPSYNDRPRQPSYEPRPREPALLHLRQSSTGSVISPANPQGGNEMQQYDHTTQRQSPTSPVVSPVHSRSSSGPHDYAMGSIGQAITRASPLQPQSQSQQRGDVGFKDAPQQASSPAMYGVQSFSPAPTPTSASPYRRSTTTTTTSTTTTTTTSRRPAQPYNNNSAAANKVPGPPQQASTPALYTTPPQQSGERIPPLPPPSKQFPYSSQAQQDRGQRDPYAQQQQGSYGYPSPPYSPQQQRGIRGSGMRRCTWRLRDGIMSRDEEASSVVDMVGMGMRVVEVGKGGEGEEDWGMRRVGR
ncbi:hypothetical protein H2203_005503 [Taxawa tesnikishii (nom. ined.)]|nr:hypothetical protein H2203_005503 [Dothideales sp. JES 119]